MATDSLPPPHLISQFGQAEVGVVGPEVTRGGEAQEGSLVYA